MSNHPTRIAFERPFPLGLEAKESLEKIDQSFFASAEGFAAGLA